jgi:YbgC/YbaW family acyl-CoA thioester hydrolase
VPVEPVSAHRITRRVQFYETDAAGVVHFSVYFRYMEEAEHALWRAAGLSIHASGSELGWPRVHVAFDYHRALRFEEEFEARIRIVAIEERTISYRCVLSRDGARIATGELTIACVARRPDESWRAVPIPPEIRERLSVAPAEAGAEAVQP